MCSIWKFPDIIYQVSSFRVKYILEQFQNINKIFSVVLGQYRFKTTQTSGGMKAGVPNCQEILSWNTLEGFEFVHLKLRIEQTYINIRAIKLLIDFQILIFNFSKKLETGQVFKFWNFEICKIWNYNFLWTSMRIMSMKLMRPMGVEREEEEEKYVPQVVIGLSAYLAGFI